MPGYDKEYIIRYVEGELPEEEIRRFEADLQQDPSLVAEVSLYKELKTTLQQRLPEEEKDAAFRNTLREMNQQYFGASSASSTPIIPLSPTSPLTTDHSRIPLTRWLTGMAAAASVILAVVLLWPSSKGIELERLSHTEMVGTGERGGNTDSLLQQAAGYFNKQEFDKALPLLDRAVKEDSTSQLALFYRGVAGWHTGALDAARKDLEQVYNGASLLRYEAAFYLALSYAGQKDNATAKEWLKKIPEGTPVSEKAKELTGKLE